MEFSASKLVRGAVLILALSSIAGCNQQNNGHHKSGRVRLRTVCATEIQKYCADEPRKRRCLRQHADTLSAGCKAALAQRRGRDGRRNRDDD